MCGTRYIYRGTKPCLFVRGPSFCGLLRIRGGVEPVDFPHLSDNDKFIAVRSNGSVVVEAVGLVRIAADHMGRFKRRAGHRIMDAAAIARLFRTRRVHDLFLSVIHEERSVLHPLAHNSAGREGTVHVVDLNPIVIDDAGFGRVGLAQPNNWATAIQRQHQKVV